MASLPASGYMSNSARTEGEMKTALDDLRDFVAQRVGGEAISELTISGGLVTPTRGVHSIDTESDASTDDLTNILTSNFTDGTLLIIRCENAARKVTLKDSFGGSGQMEMLDGNDYVLDDLKKWVLFELDNTTWKEVIRSFIPGTSAGNILILDSSAKIPAVDGSQLTGLAVPQKAWVNVTVSLSTTTINANYNVASVTRISAGHWKINFDTALSDANYVVSGSVEDNLKYWDVGVDILNTDYVQVYTHDGSFSDPATKKLMVNVV